MTNYIKIVNKIKERKKEKHSMRLVVSIIMFLFVIGVWITKSLR
jgi:hypothetical protein